ncbi:MAG: endolytic transglycosylase MltG [Patescibacteria group bacterium]
MRPIYRRALWFSIVVLVIYLIPTLFRFSLIHFDREPEQFPVTVDPRHKLIVESDKVNKQLAAPGSPLGAAVLGAGHVFGSVFQKIAETILELPFYESLSSANERIITITPGLRKEQVASLFGKSLGWTPAEQKSFLLENLDATSTISEGFYVPGVYMASRGASPKVVKDLVIQRFEQEVLSHYGTTTQEIVPLDQALTVASLIEKETLDNSDMRLVSGIIWNRLFARMNLQIDSTLQYAKAPRTSTWWPRVVPADKYITSPYNTYAHEGLPPTPIANPSVAAILAALNPLKTSCMFYFNDAKGNIVCTNTYKEHVAALKQYYGKGK